MKDRIVNGLVWFGIVGMVSLVVSCTVWMDREGKREWENRNLDPRAGWVWLDISHRNYKVCQGSTLVYYGQNTGSGAYIVRAAIPNSTECLPQ